MFFWKPSFALLHSSAFSLLLTISAGNVHGASLNCTNTSSDPSLIKNALSSAPSGSTITITGTCNVAGASIGIPENNLTLTGGATFNGDESSSYNLMVGSNTTITGLTFNNATVGVTPWPIAANVHINGNTFQNFVTGRTPALSSNALTLSSINYNKFTNIWYGGYASAGSNPGNGSGSSPQAPTGYQNLAGLDQTTVTGNKFDMVLDDGIHISFNYYLGSGGPGSSRGVVISDNEFKHIHRIALEMQATADGNCYGSSGSSGSGYCHYGNGGTSGMIIAGNYVHDPGWPDWNGWAFSIPVDWSANMTVINNSGIMNPDLSRQTCFANGSGNVAQTFESSGSNILNQGNVGAVASSRCVWGQYSVTAHGAGTDTFQNNVECGPFQSMQTTDEVNHVLTPTILDRYNYKSQSGCPAGGDLTASKINIAFSSANDQSFPAGGSGTWNAYVVSNLSIRQVQFFVDGSSAALVSQRLQDLNTNFADDRKWLYHATFDTSTLAGGSHTLVATATDASGATQSVTQSFAVGGDSVGAPTAQVKPASLSFGSQTVGSASSAQTVSISNVGTAPLAIANIAVGGANAGDFAQNSACGSSLAVGASCTVTLTFTPGAAGTTTASLSIGDNDAASPQTVALTGTGVNPSSGGGGTGGGGGGSNPLPTNLPTGMILWLANNAGVVTTGGGVSAWEDQSGNGNNAGQSDTQYQPTVVPGNDGQAAVHFNGSSGFMMVPSLPINGDNGLSVFIVSANSADLTAGYGSYAILYWPETAWWGATFFGSYQTTSHFRFGTTQAGNESSYQMAFDRTNSFGLSEWMHSGTTDSMWLNGQNLVSLPGKLEQINGVGNLAFLGVGNGGTFYAGDVSEVIVYGRALSGADRQAIERYLMAKYHL